MLTLCIRYRFNPDHLAGVRQYFETEQRVIERSGGQVVGYFLPTDFAGPTDEAMGLIDIPSMAAYEAYRQRLADHPEHKANAARLQQSGATVAMDRWFIGRVEPRSEIGRATHQTHLEKSRIAPHRETETSLLEDHREE